MTMRCLHSKSKIEAFLRKNVYLHIYSIGDLDDFFWQNTMWYSLEEGDEIQAIALLYTERPLATLHAMSERAGVMGELLRSIFHILPGRFHGHLSPGVTGVLKGQFKIESREKHYKMALNRKSLPREADCSRVVRLAENDLDEMLGLYEVSYPGNWFKPKMLETRQYFGIRIDNKLASVAGVHVYSEEYKVAALGNIVTHPDYRGRGLAKSVTARLCHSLSENLDHIGLNVKADNTAAVSLYRQLGFEIVSSYYECMLIRCARSFL